MNKNIIVFTLLMCFQMTHQLVSEASYFYKGELPQVTAHRGAAGIFPEHTLPAQKEAMYMGVDFIEPDLQPTKDNKLIVIHEWLNETTNIADFPEFACRLTTKNVNGEIITEWFPEDFTVEELKMLKRKQRYPYRDQQYNWQFEILTIDEYLEMAIEENQKKQEKGEKLVGAYLEIKLSEYFTNLGWDVNQMLLDVLKKYNLDTIKGCENKLPIVLQNFEQYSLKFFKERSDLPLVLLTSNPFVDFDLTEVASLYNGVAPAVEHILGNDFVERAHQLDLTVTPWTIHDDNLQFGMSPCEQFQILKELNVDNIFVEYPQSAHDNLRKIICEENILIN